MEQRLIRLEILNRDFHWSSSIFITEEFFSTPKGLSSSYPSAAVLHQQCLTASLHMQRWVGKRISTSSLSSAQPMHPFFTAFCTSRQMWVNYWVGLVLHWF
jgi:hypothetical protein